MITPVRYNLLIATQYNKYNNSFLIREHLGEQPCIQVQLKKHANSTL